MNLNWRRCISWVFLALFSTCFLFACSHSSLKMPKMPWWLGGRDRTNTSESKIEEKTLPDVPGNRMAGVIHLVNDRGHFVLVKSMSGGRMNVAENTVWMSYDAKGNPSAKLKVGVERKGVFVVADIVEGTPSRGDAVVLHGLMDQKGKIKTVTAPGGEEKQILE